MTTRLLLTLILFVVWLFGCVGVEPADPTLIERIFGLGDKVMRLTAQAI